MPMVMGQSKQDPSRLPSLPHPPLPPPPPPSKPRLLPARSALHPVFLCALPDLLLSPHRSALPSVHNVSIARVNGSSISVAGNLYGLEAAPFRCIQLQDVQLEMVEGGRGFRCKAVEGWAKNVWPRICPELAPSERSKRIFQVPHRFFDWRIEGSKVGCALRDAGSLGMGIQ